MIKDRRGRGPRALAAVLPKIAEPSLRRRGFASVEIVTRWSEIVGTALARDSIPVRLTFAKGARADGTLYVRATGPMALELQHLKPLVIERINTFCGYAAVAELAIVQGPAHRPTRRAAQRTMGAADPARTAALERKTNGIESEPLRAALNRLGEAVERTGSGGK